MARQFSWIHELQVQWETLLENIEMVRLFIRLLVISISMEDTKLRKPPHTSTRTLTDIMHPDTYHRHISTHTHTYSKHTWDFGSQISCCVSSPHSGSQSRRVEMNWDPCSGSTPWSSPVRLPARRQETHAEGSEGGPQPSLSGVGENTALIRSVFSWHLGLHYLKRQKCQMSLRFNFRLRLRWELTSVPGVPAHDGEARTKAFADFFFPLKHWKARDILFLSSLFSFWGLQNIDFFPLQFFKKQNSQMKLHYFLSIGKMSHLLPREQSLAT